jgi:hypothetical protein
MHFWYACKLNNFSKFSLTILTFFSAHTKNQHVTGHAISFLFFLNVQFHLEFSKFHATKGLGCELAAVTFVDTNQAGCQ